MVSYRLVYIGLAALAVAVIIAGVLLSTGGEPAPLPAPIESVFPRPGDAVLRQTAIEVDLEAGYSIELFVDGFRVPKVEATFVEATSTLRWAPSQNSLYLQEWAPGSHTIRIVWNTTTGLPDAGDFTWTFRVQ